MCDSVYVNLQTFLHTMYANARQMILANSYGHKNLGLTLSTFEPVLKIGNIDVVTFNLPYEHFLMAIPDPYKMVNSSWWNWSPLF